MEFLTHNKPLAHTCDSQAPVLSHVTCCFYLLNMPFDLIQSHQLDDSEKLLLPLD